MDIPLRNQCIVKLKNFKKYENKSILYDDAVHYREWH